MKKILYCSVCGRIVARIEKGKVMKNLFIKCKYCSKESSHVNCPEFLKGIFGGKV